MDFFSAPPSSNTPGILHYIPPISVFEPVIERDTGSSSKKNTLLWIGGLFDTVRSTTYPYTIAHDLPPSWSLAQVVLSSSNHGWGHGSLDQDVEEMEKAIHYFKTLKPGGKIVLMGHSTGCQDGIHYVLSVQAKNSEDLFYPPVDGLILQAPVSDREAIVSSTLAEVYKSTNELAQSWIDDGRGDDCLPFGVTRDILGSCPVSAKRWISLASPDGKGQDDYFSSDLDDATLRSTFGRLGEKKTPLLILFSGSDESVPESVNKEKLLKRWIGFVHEGGGVVDESSAVPVKGATHSLNGCPDEVVQDLCGRVVKFLKGL